MKSFEVSVGFRGVPSALSASEELNKVSKGLQRKSEDFRELQESSRKVCGCFIGLFWGVAPIHNIARDHKLNFVDSITLYFIWEMSHVHRIKNLFNSILKICNLRLVYQENHDFHFKRHNFLFFQLLFISVVFFFFFLFFSSKFQLEGSINFQLFDVLL